MTKTDRPALKLLIVAAATLLPLSAAPAQDAPARATTAAVPGAMPNDKALTCEMIAGERTAIHEAVASKAQKREKSAKLKKGIFGFAKGMASAMVPGAALLTGGGSPLGSLAAQGASQSAANLLAGSGNGAAATPAAAEQPTAEQQARLTRLDSIATFRQCAA